MLDAPWQAFAEELQLTIHPPKPTRDTRECREEMR